MVRGITLSGGVNLSLFIYGQPFRRRSQRTTYRSAQITRVGAGGAGGGGGAGGAGDSWGDCGSVSVRHNFLKIHYNATTSFPFRWNAVPKMAFISISVIIQQEENVSTRVGGFDALTH